jgi:hypothetical protein
MPDLPFPPEEYRRLVGPTEVKFFDNPTGAPVFAGLPLEMYASVCNPDATSASIATRG